MTAVELLHECQARDIRLRVDGERVVYDAPAGAMTPERLALLRQHKAELLALLAQDGPPVQSPAPPSVDLHTPLDDLQEPVHVWSNILGEDFWVCATPQQAAPLRAEGKGVYLPGEIRILRLLHERWPESFPEKLRVIHQAKQAFGATVTEALLPQAEDEAACPSR